MAPAPLAQPGGSPATEREHGTAAAGGPARIADLAAVEDEEVGGARPALLGHELHEPGLDLQGVARVDEAQPIRHAQDVRVHRDALVHAVGVAGDHVGGLAPDARQRRPGSRSSRGTSPPCFSTSPRAKPTMLRVLARKKPVERMIASTSEAGACRERGRGREAAEEDGRHHVHALVGALRGEDRGHGQLEGVPVVEGAAGFGVRLLENVEDAHGALRRGAELPAGRRGAFPPRARGARALQDAGFASSRHARILALPAGLCRTGGEYHSSDSSRTSVRSCHSPGPER